MLICVPLNRAETDFWCSQPDNLENWMSKNDWISLSSPNKDDPCQIYDFPFESIKTLRDLKGEIWNLRNS